MLYTDLKECFYNLFPDMIVPLWVIVFRLEEDGDLILEYGEDGEFHTTLTEQGIRKTK